MKYLEVPKKERANKRRQEADGTKETKQKEVEEDKKNNETEAEEEQNKQSYKDASSSQADGTNKEINDHLINRILREDIDVFGSLGAEQNGEEVRAPQGKKKKNTRGRMKNIGNMRRRKQSQFSAQEGLVRP